MFTLNEALDAIKNKPEFSHNYREGFSVIDYNLTMTETFVGETERQSLILRNLRGTCFDGAGNIIRLGFHKFENLGQSPEYMPENFDFSAPHRIEQKLDGSAIFPIPFKDSIAGFRLGTRAGVTDVALMAEKFMSQMPTEKFDAYVKFINVCLLSEMTPIFEYCSRENRVVIDHPVSKLVLIGVRSIVTGEYLDRNFIDMSPYIDTVPVVSTEASDIRQFAEYVNTLVDDEGVVVKFDDGRYVKIKAADYIKKHRALDGLKFEKQILQLVLTGLLDDVLPLVQPDLKERLVAYNDSVLHRIQMATDEMRGCFDNLKHITLKKDFAELVKQSPYRVGLFKMYDGKEYSLKDFVLSKCGSSTDVESVRWLIGPEFNSF